MHSASPCGMPHWVRVGFSTGSWTRLYLQTVLLSAFITMSLRKLSKFFWKHHPVNTNRGALPGGGQTFLPVS